MIAPTSPAAQPNLTAAAKAPAGLTAAARGEASDAGRAAKLKETFTQFVGETFYGQMLKSMRATVGEPAYFHGGSAERQFQARLDQQLAQDMASSGSAGLADDLFESQFPAEAELLREAQTPLAALDGLRRR